MRARTKFAVGGSILVLLAVVFIIKSQGAPRAPASTIVMQSDLKNLALLQGYMKDSTGRYAPSVELLDYRLSDGVTTPTIVLTPDGYTIELGYRGTATRCVIYAGTTPLAPATRPGVPACGDRSD